MQSNSSIYAASGATTVPLTFDASAITMQHLLSLFTPPPEMKERCEILDKVQSIISQLEEPFNPQRMLCPTSWLRNVDIYMEVSWN